MEVLNNLHILGHFGYACACLVEAVAMVDTLNRRDFWGDSPLTYWFVPQKRASKPKNFPTWEISGQ